MHHLTAIEVLEGLKRREFSAVELVRHYLERIEKLNTDNLSRGRHIGVLVNKVKRENYLKAIEEKNLSIVKKIFIAFESDFCAKILIAG